MSRRSLSHYQAGKPFARALEVRLHRRLAAAVGNSRAVVSDLIGEGVSVDRVALLYNGVDLTEFDTAADRNSARARLGVGDQELCMAMVANLIPYKGHIDLIDALGRISDRLSIPWRVMLIGRDGGIRSDLEFRIEAAGLTDRVVFLGARDDVPDLLAACDIGVLCSHEEGFSNTVLEGMASGLPMVVTDVGGNAEAVIDGKVGFVTPPRDPEALGEAILRLARDPAKARAMGHAARERAGSMFGQSVCVDNYEQLYHCILSGAAPGTVAELAINRE